MRFIILYSYFIIITYITSRITINNNMFVSEKLTKQARQHSLLFIVYCLLFIVYCLLFIVM